MKTKILGILDGIALLPSAGSVYAGVDRRRNRNINWLPN